MNREELVAPEQYNLVSEFEKYATIRFKGTYLHKCRW